MNRLLKLLEGNTTKVEREGIGSGLLRISASTDISQLSRALETSSIEGQSVIINVLAARKAVSEFNRVSALLSFNQSDLDHTIYEALPDLSSAKNLNSLLEILAKTTDASGIKKVQLAIIKAIDENPDDNSPEILTSYKSMKNSHRLLPIFVALNNEESIDELSKVLKKGSEIEKRIAIETLSVWRNNEAINQLYKALMSTSNEVYKNRTFNAYLKQISSSNLPDDQKLLLIKKAVPYAKNTTEKKSLLSAAREVKTFLSLVFIADYLNDPELINFASNTAIAIALPKPGVEGLEGEIVRDIVQKSINNLTGPDSQYLKIDVKEFLDQMPKTKGFVSIFNGKDLSGWKGLVDNPIVRSKLSDQQLAKKQVKADAEMKRDWLVDRGTLKFVGQGFKNICTEKKYGDIELLVDWKIGAGGDSGVYLRGTPQVQIWDTALTEVGAQVGSGGLYNNLSGERKPLVVADNPVNEWNTFRIKIINSAVTVYLNGQLVVDEVNLENYWDRSMPLFPSESIELQAHGENVTFKNIFIKELAPSIKGLTAKEKADGFTSLFNGKDLEQWQGNKTDYFAHEGELHVRPENGGHGNLYTLKEYSDFIFRFEFQLTPGANNGLGIHTPLKGDAAYEGKELQILDNSAKIYEQLKAYQYHGSVYGIIPAKRGFQKPVGEWNEQEVLVKGERIK